MLKKEIDERPLYAKALELHLTYRDNKQQGDAYRVVFFTLRMGEVSIELTAKEAHAFLDGVKLGNHTARVMLKDYLDRIIFNPVAAI